MKTYPRLFILLILLFTATYASAQLTAGFTASPMAGCAPLLVTFTNTTTPAAGTTYSWTFGTTGTSILTNPSTSFTDTGLHVVTLTATNGSTTSTYSVAIRVYPPPTVSFTASSTAVCPGTPVTFTNTSIGGVPGPMDCTWSFGDGSPTSTGGTATHTYAAPGFYSVTLFVTNAQGCTASLIMTAYVQVYTPPVASFTWSPLGVCNPPGSITFTNTSTGAGPMSSAWTFGDGGTGSGSPTPHAYTAVGAYNVHLVTTDAHGCKDSVTLGPVHVDTINAQFTNVESACVFAAVTFTNISSPHTTRTWNFGDGSPTTTSFNGLHTYSAPGTYVVTLTISNPPCSSTITHTITILPGPAADFTIAHANPCPAPVSLTYTATGPAGTLYTWLFESGSPGTGSPVTHTYPTNGIKTVKMIVVDPATGCRDTVIKKDTLYDIDFVGHASPYEGCVPLTVNFSTDIYTHIPAPGTYPYPFPITSFTWNFGDGAPVATGGTPTHTYTAAGIYIATVTATTANGCPVTDTIKIRVGNPPVVTFTATPRHVCYGAHTPIVFTPAIVIGPVDEYHWVFGDGGLTVYDTTNPPLTVTHTYTLPGIFTVSVTPYYRGCPGVTYFITNYITIDSPKSIIGDTVLCAPFTRVMFYNNSLGYDSHLWLFGDATTSAIDDPVHDYPSAGPYTVKLATYNAASGCRDTATKTINLVDTQPQFTASDTVICRGESVTFTSTVTGGSATNYYWYIDGTPWGTSAPGLSHIFNTTGYHTVMLVIRNSNGCFDTATRTNYIFVSQPTSGFTAPVVSGCRPLTVTFSDASTAFAGTSIVGYVWDFGDGSPAVTGTPVTHTYTAAGSFSVSHTVTDNIGCQDEHTISGYVNVYHPVASFTASTTHPCPYGTVTFNNTSSGGATTPVWDFGDGSAPGTGSPVTHTYSAVGTYNIQLSVTDAHGCSDVTTYPAYIDVTRPHAAFTMSDSVSVCPPLFVNFYNASTGATSYLWDLGDATTSVVPSPADMYITPGLYTIRLIATNTYGCKDTAVHSVNIFGYAGAFSYTPLQGCAPLAVHFTATLSNVPFITWDFSDGTTSTIAYTDTITHIYATPGAYVPKLLLSDNTGCQNSSIGIDTIKVDAITASFTTLPHPVCIGIPFSFIDSSATLWSPVTGWTWTYDGNTSNLQSPTYTINTPGTYPATLVAVNGWGCIGAASGDIIVLPPPVVTASADTVVCLGDPATLWGFGALTYSWSPAASVSCNPCNPAGATPPAETTFTVTGTDQNGCIDTATVTVKLRTHTEGYAWGDTAVCAGVTVQVYDTGGTTYLWLPSAGLSDNTISAPDVTAPYTTTYMAIAKLAGCIPDTNYVTVTIYPLPTVDAGADQRLLAGSPAQLSATGTLIHTYEWSPSESLSCTDCYNPVASMSVMTTYNVDVYSINGCKASDSVKIMLYCDNSQVYIPNAFTPNGDGQNDVFYPRGIGVKVVKTFRIYNRWGELLFERENIQLNDAVNAWDGSYKGEAPKADVFVYIIEAVCYTGDDIFIKGDVTILR